MSKTKIIEDTEKIINGEDQEEELTPEAIKFMKDHMPDDRYQEMMAWLEGDDDEEESKKGGDKDA